MNGIHHRWPQHRDAGAPAMYKRRWAERHRLGNGSMGQLFHAVAEAGWSRFGPGTMTAISPVLRVLVCTLFEH